MLRKSTKHLVAPAKKKSQFPVRNFPVLCDIIFIIFRN